MASSKSRRLVIDTSVAQAAGRSNNSPPSKPCRDFLLAVLEICHHFVMTPDLRAEWNRHQTEFVSEWRKEMIARKKFHFVSPDENDLLRENLEKCATNGLAVKAEYISPRSLSQLNADDPNENAKAAMLKDLCLLEAALATDKTVISLDNTVRNLFAVATEQITEIRSIVWVNPNEDEEKTQAWLEKGAKPDKSLRLDFIQNE